MNLPKTFSKEKNTIYAVIETPQRSQNKLKYDPENDFFILHKVLPSGTAFPLDFGFIPHTQGEDGDPLDVMVMADYPSFPGMIVECRLLGVIECEQKEKGEKAIRNDRILAVASESLCHSDLKKVEDLNDHLLDEIIHFFEYYNEMENRKFKFLKLRDDNVAIKLIKKHLQEESLK